MAAAPQAEAPVAAPTQQPAPRAETPTDFDNLLVAQPTPPPVVHHRQNPTRAAPRRASGAAGNHAAAAARRTCGAPVITPPPQRVARVEPPPVRTPQPARLSTYESNPEARAGPSAASSYLHTTPTIPAFRRCSPSKSLAGELSTALGDGTSRVQLLAYGGPRGDKSSDTRRLSLKRALIVRQILIDQGVPAERIDVRAMGGTDDKGPLDRVDVFLKS